MKGCDQKKILYLSAFNTPEAGNRVLLTWLDFLKSNGHEVFLAYPGSGWMLENLKKWPDLVILRIKFLSPSLFYFPQILLGVLRIVIFIKKHKISLIHCNSESAYYMGSLAARISNVPILIHFRFHFPAEYYQWLFKGKRRPNGVFFVSKSFFDEEISKLRNVAPSAPGWVIHNCLDLSLFTPQASNSHNKSHSRDRVTIVYPAAIQKLKNQYHIFELNDRLREMKMEVNFIIAGKIKEQDYWKLCYDKLQLDSNRNIKFIGHVDDVKTLYLNADISISLSHYETFGLSILESMSLGVPVVCYAVPAVQEVVGECGLLVPVNDIEAVANAITTLITNENLRIHLSTIAQQRVRDNFSPHVIVPRLLVHYRETLPPKNQNN